MSSSLSSCKHLWLARSSALLMQSSHLRNPLGKRISMTTNQKEVAVVACLQLWQGNAVSLNDLVLHLSPTRAMGDTMLQACLQAPWKKGWERWRPQAESPAPRRPYSRFAFPRPFQLGLSGIITPSPFLFQNGCTFVIHEKVKGVSHRRRDYLGGGFWDCRCILRQNPKFIGKKKIISRPRLLKIIEL